MKDARQDQNQFLQGLSTASPNDIEWDESQRKVIDFCPCARLLVEAGPGTGKTEVACMRVARLINQEEIEPNKIWLISFTRTAVREIRDRIVAYLEDRKAAYAVTIATLDSHAWAIHSGFDGEAKILGSYEENIKSVLNLVRQDQDVSECLERAVKHLIIDEAQDIVGIRADLAVAIIQKLSLGCGVTVFSDEAQAIYGFADDQAVKVGDEIKASSVSKKIRQKEAGEFIECELTEVHRTASPQLLKILSETRRKILTIEASGSSKLDEIREDIRKHAHNAVEVSDKGVVTNVPDVPARDDAFLLYRRRCDVLMASSYLMENSIPHRVRMSGLPVCLAPWIGAALAEHTEPELSLNRFMELWAERVHDTPFASCQRDDAWAQLFRAAGVAATAVGMQKLRQCLGRKQPPAEFCRAELGSHGFIVGTIHASKGREADIVHLMLPRKYTQNVDKSEEARVLFVGATRGRSQLFIGNGYNSYRVKKIEESGRVYRLLTANDKDRKSHAQVEIGHDKDIEATGLAGSCFFASPDQVRASQDRIRSFIDKTVLLVAENDPSANFSYRLRENKQDQCLAVLSQAVNKDLFTVVEAVQKRWRLNSMRPPDNIPCLYACGVRTVVVPVDTSAGGTLHEPWGSSGIMLAPLVLGYSPVQLQSKKGEWDR